MKARTGLAALAFLAAFAAQADGVVETPTHGETTSGIGTISGWHCTARAVTVRIDAFPPLAAGTGTERKDTVGICGQGNVNTGFSLLFNFNDLPTGAHTIVAFADGTEFARVSFTTTTLGAAFLTGKSGQRRILRNFPEMNQSTLAQWHENRQQFTIVGRNTGALPPAPSPVAGTYYGAAGTQCLTDNTPVMTEERFARFDVSISADNQAMSVQVRYFDGFQCTLSGAMTVGADGFFVAAAPTSTCQLGNTNLRIEADGVRVKGVLGSVPGNGCNTTRAFYGVKPARLE